MIRAMSIKIYTKFLMEINMLILKFIWDCKGLRIAKPIWKNNIVEFTRFVKPDIKTYRVIVIKNNLVLAHGNQ